MNAGTYSARPEDQPAERVPPPDTASRLGATMLALVTAKHGALVAESWARSLVEPTFPGTPARTAQDAAWHRLTVRLVKAVDGEGE